MDQIKIPRSLVKNLNFILVIKTRQENQSTELAQCIAIKICKTRTFGAMMIVFQLNCTEKFSEYPTIGRMHRYLLTDTMFVVLSISQNSSYKSTSFFRFIYFTFPLNNLKIKNLKSYFKFRIFNFFSVLTTYGFRVTIPVLFKHRSVLFANQKCSLFKTNC